MPAKYVSDHHLSSSATLGLTRILGILRANIVITSIQYILVHERRTGSNLSEKGDLDGLANLDSLAFLHEDLARVLASILAVERWNTVLFGVMALLERLESGHEVMSAGDAVCDDTFCDTGGNGTFDNGGDRVHRTDDLGLELWGHVKFDLLEEVLRCTETTDYQDVLQLLVTT
jgi:hypothetical protein